MKIDTVSNMNYNDPAALAGFFFTHYMAHAQYASAIAVKYSQNTPMFDLVDVAAQTEWVKVMGKKDEKLTVYTLDVWLRRHNDLHNAETEVLGLGNTVALEPVDFSDEEQFYDWLSDHLLVHQLQDGALGL